MVLRKRILAAVVLGASVIGFMGCSEDEEDIPVKSIVVTAANGEATVEVGKTLVLTAVKTPSDATSEIIWTSSDPSVATVAGSNTTATVTGVSDGSVSIIAKGNDSLAATATYSITVGAGAGNEFYKEFANYPDGKQDSTGTLTLKNQVNGKVLVFTDSVSPANYIGTIPALESIKVKLNSGKFYNIVAVQQSVYESNPTLAAQTSKLAYYSDMQAYTVSVSPENLTGSATWIFNNNTNYWVSVEHVDNSGETFAVIAPTAKRVSIPVQTNASYPYKVVYKKELKYNNITLAVAEKTSMAENDEASFYNLTTFTTDLNGTATQEYDDLAPTVQFINNSGKTVRVYNGQVQLTDAGITADDYTLASGVTAFFPPFTHGTSITSLNVRSIAWT